MQRCRMNLTRAAQSKGGLATARKRRAIARAKFAALASNEVYRMGFQVGWKAGVRYVRRCAA